MKRRRSASLLGALLLLAGGAAVHARADPEDRVPPALRGIRIEDRAGVRVPLDLGLADHQGRERPLGAFCDGTTPVVLVLGYFRCPMLCGIVFDRLRGSLAAAAPELGRDYRVAAVSIDPRETTEDARARRDAVLAPSLDLPPGDAAGWSFLVGEESATRAVADAVGFRYRFDRASGQYAHATGVFVLTAEGRLSRTLQGLEFSPATFERALADAAAGRIAERAGSGSIEAGGGALDALLVQCYRFLPSLRRHAGSIEIFLRGGAALAVLGLVSVCVLAVRRRRARTLEEPAP